MAAIRLLSAPAAIPPTVEVSSQPTSLVATTGLALAARTSSQSGRAYLKDGYLWSVSPGDDGSFHFYAVPRKYAANLALSQWQDRMPAQSSASGWETLQTRSAAAQYAFCAGLFPSMYGHSLDVYA
jgi:hypothetical protein